MREYVEVHEFRSWGSPTFTQGVSSFSDREHERFSWDETVSQPEDSFFDVERVLTLTGGVLVDVRQVDAPALHA